MKRFLFAIGTFVAGVVVTLSLVAARFEPTIRPNTYVGLVPVGGLSREEAARKLRIWWETEKSRPVAFTSKALRRSPPPMAASELGMVVDDWASVRDLPLEELGEYALRSLKREDAPETRAEVVLKMVGGRMAPLSEFVKANSPQPRPARVRWQGGALRRQREESSLALDEPKVPEAVLTAFRTNEPVELPLTEADKRVPDQDLEKVRALVHEFSTSFNARDVNRSSNIRLASSRFDGLVLMPGERLSFNEIVGRRSVAAGFKLAGVYKNGRHDTGIGGGICQVSTTLYNAALFANLKVLKRLNHSMPVPYVPVGRDATVDYGNIDLLIENSHQTPIAVESEYKPGRLTFRILGAPQPGLEVKLVASGHKSWDRGVKTVPDPGLPSGKQKVIEKGSRGHSITTHRLVYRDGKLVNKEPLGVSRYAGAVRIIAVGSKPAVSPTVAATPPAPPPDPFAGY